MSYTAANSNLIPQIYSKDLEVEVSKMAFISKFMGKGNVIIKDVDFTRQKGTTYNFGLRKLLTAQGVVGDSKLVGNEESMTTYSDSVAIDQIRNAVINTGRMEEQKAAYNMRENAKMGLAEWLSARMDAIGMAHLCGDTSETFPATPLAASANRVIYGNGQSSEAALTSADGFSANLIRKAKVKAMMVSPKIRPINVGGKEYYVMFIHPYQRYLLTNDTDWMNAQLNAAERGIDNPIFTGAVGWFDGVVVHEHDRVYWNTSINGSGLDGARAVLCGQGALMYAEGPGPTWVERYEDYENEFGVATGKIFGIKKVRFNSEDYSTITVSTYAPAV